MRTGPPHDDPEDYDTDTWAGVLPAKLIFGAAEPDPELRAGVSLPGHLRALCGAVEVLLTCRARSGQPDLGLGND